MVLVIIAVVWMAVLVPPLLKARTQRSVDPITDFNYRLGVLGRTNGSLDMARSPEVRESRTNRSARRRREVLQVLGVAIAVTFLLAYFVGGPLLWGLQVLADLALFGFLGLWAYARSLQLDRAVKVRRLPAYAPPMQARRRMDAELRRAASS